ncbi:hypothetical protein HDZ31DRAFT_81051 [Schizophyllum fasciatum]
MATTDDSHIPRVLRPQPSASTLGASLQTLCAASLSALPLYTHAHVVEPHKLESGKALSCDTICQWDDCAETLSEAETVVEPCSATDDATLNETLDCRWRELPLDALADLACSGPVQRGLGWEWWEDDEDDAGPRADPNRDLTSPPPYTPTPSPSPACDEAALLRAAHEAALRARFCRAWVPADDACPCAFEGLVNPPLSVRLDGESVGRSPVPAGYARRQPGARDLAVSRLRRAFLELLRARKRAPARESGGVS